MTRTAALPRLVVVALALALVGVLTLVAGAFWYRSASQSEALAYAEARDAATVQGRQDIVVMNSIDTADVEASLARWLEVSTGVLHDQVAQMPDAQKTTLQESGATTTATVVEAVVTELDERAGSAQLIASLELVVRDKEGTATTKRNRFSAQLRQEGGRWKLAELEQVAVTVS